MSLEQFQRKKALQQEYDAGFRAGMSEHVKTLQPGFLIITIPADADDPNLVIPGWEEMTKRGWSGGVIVREGITFESFDDKTMNALGWFKKN